MIRLSDGIPYRSGGYWGAEPGGAEVDAKAVRNGDVGNSGELKWGDLPLRGYTTREIAKAQVRAGDILLTSSGNCGNVAFVSSEPTNITVATNFVRILRVDPRLVDPRYVFHFLRTRQFLGGIEPFVRGATIKNLSVESAFKALEMPAPDLAEQRRIAALLDHADALRAKRRRILAHLDDLTQSTFVDMFGHPVTGSRCPRAAVGSIAEVRTGNSPSRAIPENFGDAIEWVKSDNLAGGFVERASEGLSARGKSVARIAPAGSVLVTCIAGSAASIGRAAVADREVAFNQQINAVLPSGDIHPYFLLTQFKVAPDLVRGKSTGGMKGMVSKSAFQAIQILLPPLGDQREFAKRMERVFALRARVEGLVRLDDELFASLQSRAFKGEL